MIDFGVVGRDDHIMPQFCWTQVHHGSWSALVAEAPCLKEVRSWLKGVGFTNLVVESNAQSLVTKAHCHGSLYNNGIDATKLEIIIRVCRRLALQCPHVKTRHVKRTTDAVVDS
ncbi:hypothetical protein M5689_014595 [Euphorbia peplus]|nr:hypothetical protein M5689_014595 [Euphorbia peplus]